MARSRSQEAFGIFLVTIGLLFLLVSNRLLWFGWETVWPAIPLLVGVLLLRIYVSRRKPRQLFLGALLTQLGIFFFLFSAGVLSWDAMGQLWPTVPLVIGISLLAISGVVEPAAAALVTGAFFLLAGVFGYLFTYGAVPQRLREPVIRVWPLALVGAGLLVYLRSRRTRTLNT